MEDEICPTTLRDKCHRANGLLKCLGYAVERPEIMEYTHRPHWYLIEQIEEIIEEISEGIKEL